MRDDRDRLARERAGRWEVRSSTGPRLCSMRGCRTRLKPGREQCATHEYLTTPAPPLTEAEFARFEDDMSRIDDRVGGGMCVVEVHDAEAVLKAARRSLTLESELAQLRREKAEREELSTLLGRMRESGWMVAVHNDYVLNGERFTFWGFSRGNEWLRSEGKTDEAALAAVLEKDRGVAGDRCEAGNECGRLGCPECQQ